MSNKARLSSTAILLLLLFVLLSGFSVLPYRILPVQAVTSWQRQKLSTTSTGSSSEDERTVLTLGGYTYVFFLNSSNMIHYRSSSDLVTYSAASYIVTTNQYYSWCVSKNSSMFMLIFCNGTDSTSNMTAVGIWYRTGTQSSGVITWSDDVQITRVGGYNVFDCMSTRSYWYYSSCSYHIGGYRWYVWNTLFTSMSWVCIFNSTTLGNVGYNSPADIEKHPALADGCVVVGSSWSGATYRYSIYNGTAWTAEATYGTKGTSLYAHSSSTWRSSDFNDSYFLFKEFGTKTLYFGYLNSSLSWSTFTAMGASVVDKYDITATGDLLRIVYMISTKFYIDNMTYSTHAWAGATEITALGTDNTVIALSLHCEQNPGGHMTATYINGTSPYNVICFSMCADFPDPSLQGNTATENNATTTIYCYWESFTDMSHYIFGWNNSGSSVNDTAQAFSPPGIAVWSNVSRTISTTVGFVIEWCIWANNSAGFWNSSSSQCFTVTATVTFYFSANGTIRERGTDVANGSSVTYSTPTASLAALPDATCSLANWSWSEGWSGTSTNNPLVFNVYNATAIWAHFSTAGGAPTYCAIARFDFEPSDPYVNVLLTFNATQTYNTTAVTDYSWNFDDGNTTAGSDLIAVTHNYTSIGLYNVSLTVTSSGTNSAFTFHLLNVTVNLYLSGWEAGNSSGYSDGYSAGYSVGYSDGYDVGYDDGYDVGWEAGNASGYVTGWEAGNSSGYSSGWEAGNSTGYAAGWTAGNLTGYSVGWTAGNSTGYVLGWTDGNYTGYLAGFAAGGGSGGRAGYAAYWFAGLLVILLIAIPTIVFFMRRK